MPKNETALKFAIFGTGFWSRYQLAGWRELEGAECVAAYNRTREKAQRLAEEFNIPRVYDNPEELLDQEDLDFVDIITSVETHAPLTKLVASKGIPVICQKPFSTDLASAKSMIDACEQAGVPLLVNENWRWQPQIRALKDILSSGAIGTPWRAHVIYNNSFPVFENQPFLKELERFILTDVGTHVFDAVRCLFGEVETLYAHTHKVHKDIAGEDAATVITRMKNGMTVVNELSYASRWSRENFPQTYITIEGEDASLELDPDFQIKLTTKEGTKVDRFPPVSYPWADERYGVVHSSIVECQRNLLAGLNGTGVAETTGADNYETLRIVYGAYESAETGQPVSF